ncbi:MAG TPA: hypothetical protein VF398_01175, partial [bacterium]
PHDDNEVACIRAVQIFLQSGSHYLTHADWGCKDGVHKAWITVDAENKDEARTVLPVPFRSRAQIVGLSKFTLDQIEGYLRQHEAQNA